MVLDVGIRVIFNVGLLYGYECRSYNATNVAVYNATNVAIVMLRMSQFIMLRMSQMTTNIAVFNATNVAGVDECALRNFHMSRFFRIS